MKSVKRLTTSGLLLLICGCSSMMSHTGGDQGYYPGTRANIDTMKKKDTSWAMMPLLAIDLPFSAVMDTILLPYDYLRSDDDKTTQSPKARVERDEAKNLSESGNPGQGMPTPSTPKTTK
ncbi:YceK/YidQ family lipoprotein [Serratia sp. S1B]|nr:YceK/YidQ family lipoprotein [Serratia sp. S1B]